MLWLALQFPHLGLEVWPQEDSRRDQAAADEPQRAPRPAVLLEDNKVVLCNEAAIRTGIRPGASLATAHSIAGNLIHHQRDEARERKRLHFIGDTLYRFSAQVSLAPPDALIMEIGGSLALFGDARTLARQARDLCRALGHRVRCRLAGTPAAALVMATAGARQLEAVPLTHARLPGAAKHLERLANMGLKTLGALLELPDVELGRRFGPELVGYLARLTGRVPDPQVFLQPSAGFDQALHLLEPVKDKATLLSQSGASPMEQLLRALEAWLVSHQLGAEQLIWSFSTHTEEDRVVLPLSFARPQQQQRAFLNIVRLRLAQVELPDDILNVRLEAGRLVSWPGGNQSLFRLLPGNDGDRNGINDEAGIAGSSELVDQLHARLGRGACARIAVRDQHAPESAWQPVRGPMQGSSGARPAASASGPSLSQPLWLFDPPHPADPAQLTLIRGPERIQTAWWQKTIWRDYYVASLANGARCWVFVDVRRQWYLHGYFG